MSKQNAKMNWLDRAIGFFNPQEGYKRVAWRQGMRNYDAGSTGRFNSGWTAVNAPAEQVNQAQRDILRARARDLERNSDIAESVIGPLERNVVGTGIIPQAKVLEADNETEDEKLNNKIEELWKNWCSAENCDITGQSTFAEMQDLAIRRKNVDGGLLFVMSANPYKNAEVPFILQMREVDEIDNTKFSYAQAGQNRIVNGIELNEYNKPVAYWLKTISPDGISQFDSVRVPAERVIYLRNIIRPSQIREVSELARTIERIRDINEYSEAISVKERILACLAVFIKKTLPTSSGPGRSNEAEKDSSTGYENKKLSPGLVTELNAGDDVSVVNPAGQANNAKDFISTQLRLIGGGQGLSYEAVSRDLSQVNFSSARQGYLEDQRTYKMLQKYLIEHFCKIVYREFVTAAVLAEKLNIPDFFENKERYLRHTWITPGWPWIDPLKEVKANETALDTNQTTLEEICASGGRDWREVMKQRAQEIKYAKQLGITTEGSEDAGTKK